MFLRGTQPSKRKPVTFSVSKIQVIGLGLVCLLLGLACLALMVHGLTGASSCGRNCAPPAAGAVSAKAGSFVGGKIPRGMGSLSGQASLAPLRTLPQRDPVAIMQWTRRTSGWDVSWSPLLFNRRSGTVVRMIEDYYQDVMRLHSARQPSVLHSPLQMRVGPSALHIRSRTGNAMPHRGRSSGHGTQR